MVIYNPPGDHCVIRAGENWFELSGFSFDTLFQAGDPAAIAREALTRATPLDHPLAVDSIELDPPMDHQEVWAAGVTYYRSRDARMEESEQSGGATFYDKVYDADRPELFIKGGRSRTVGHLQNIVVRSDSNWDVPEPELTLAVNASGKIFGFTIGNDVSSRAIEGDNLLYLPQAKVWRNSCALGPGLLLAESVNPESTAISVRIEREGSEVFAGATTLSQMKRSPGELVDFLMRDNVFPDGCYLMTGTGVVPDADFTLQSGDLVEIRITGLGVLANEVE